MVYPLLRGTSLECTFLQHLPACRPSAAVPPPHLPQLLRGSAACCACYTCAAVRMRAQAPPPRRLQHRLLRQPHMPAGGSSCRPCCSPSVAHACMTRHPPTRLSPDCRPMHAVWQRRGRAAAGGHCLVPVVGLAGPAVRYGRRLLLAPAGGPALGRGESAVGRA